MISPPLWPTVAAGPSAEYSPWVSGIGGKASADLGEACQAGGQQRCLREVPCANDPLPARGLWRLNSALRCHQPVPLCVPADSNGFGVPMTVVLTRSVARG